MVPAPSCNKSLEGQHQAKRNTFGMLKSYWIHNLLKSESTRETKRSKPTTSNSKQTLVSSSIHSHLSSWNHSWRCLELPQQFVSRNVSKIHENPLHDFIYLILMSEFHQDVLMFDFKQISEGQHQVGSKGWAKLWKEAVDAHHESHSRPRLDCQAKPQNGTRKLYLSSYLSLSKLWNWWPWW